MQILDKVRLSMIWQRSSRYICYIDICFKGICELDISQYVSFRIYTRNLRGIDNLTLSVPFSSTEAFKNSYFIRIYVDCGMGYPCMYT